MESTFRSAEELAAAVRAREVTPAELTDEAIARIERDDKAINAIRVRVSVAGDHSQRPVAARGAGRCARTAGRPGRRSGREPVAEHGEDPARH
ncbi:hypothetical protein [Nonomuraea sp. NPDC003201]